ncbi:MAG: NADP(H)-dependent aldo-keto reductase [Porticoccaceae bacterium]|nr:NADP(H)-dependent aldo-keto reductase [Porticoccaceae bacterium]
MQYKKLGKSSLEVSVIGLGTMTWGEQNSEQDAFEQMDYAFSQGVNLLDAAEMYPVPPRPETAGRTETYIGNWLADRDCRSDIVLATKVVGRSDSLSGAGHIRGGSRLNRDHIRRAVEGSLQRLRTDSLDLYQIHWPERATNFFGQRGYRHNPAEDGIAIADTLEALGELVAEGIIKHIGISNETSWGLMEYIRVSEQRDLPRLISVQNPYSLLTRQYEVGLAEMGLRESVGLLAYSPLAFGVLSGKYLNNQLPNGSRLALFKRFSRYTSQLSAAATGAYAEVAAKYQMTLTQMALAFVCRQPFVGSCLIGATSMPQLVENIASHSCELAPELLSDIEEVASQHPDPAA